MVDLCVIGAGSGGLVAATIAAGFGEQVVLIEKAEMGGDCLNTGCVPSKAMLAAAKRAHMVADAARFGISISQSKIDFTAVKAHVDAAIAAIEPHDSQQRFEKMGVRVIRETARFIDEKTVRAGQETITARRFIIATGSRANVPNIPGLAECDYLTNENLFHMTKLPRHLIILGGGPVGLEMAQAHRRLGARVTVLEMHQPLAREDAELARIVCEKLQAEGVEIITHARVSKVAQQGKKITVHYDSGRGGETVTGSHLLVAIGRRPNHEDMGLDAAGVGHDVTGIEVDGSLRTKNRRIYAIGDCIGGKQFTHIAGWQAGLVCRSILFRLPIKLNDSHIPSVIYTGPELAQVGMNEYEAREKGYQIRVVRAKLENNDRAICEAERQGLVKLVIGRNGRILGAGIIGANAGELIMPVALAMSSKLRLKALIDMVAPYPVMSEAIRHAAIEYYRDLNQSPWLRAIIKGLKYLP